MRIIYYTIEKETYPNGMENGLITINLYWVVDGLLKKVAELETDTDSPFTYEEEIQEWVDENEPNEEFDFMML